MVRKVIWSSSAKAEKISILKFWITNNKSFKYSKKLDLLFKEQVKLISKNPAIGHLTKQENVRVKIIKYYLIIYELTFDVIHILSIIDGRQNPEEINKRF